MCFTAQAVGGIHRFHDISAQLGGDHDGYDLTLGLKLQVISLLQLLQPGQPGLDDGAAPGAGGFGGGHHGFGVALVYGHQNHALFFGVLLHGSSLLCLSLIHI